jgi:hypothetical protein
MLASPRSPAPSHDILNLRRCNCNTSKAQGISGPLHSPVCVCRGPNLRRWAVTDAATGFDVERRTNFDFAQHRVRPARGPSVGR